MIKTITADALRKLMQEREVVLVDVREPAEHKAENISGASLIPLATISHDKLKSKTAPIVVHCRSGKRSLEACQKLEAQDPTLELYSLEGGIIAWKQAGCAINTPGSCALPLERQLQITAGVLAFTGVLLGALINPWFNALSGFVGLGLTFAGITGWCGTTKILAIMPWNK